MNRKQNELRALAGATFRGLGERVRAFSSFRSWAVSRATRFNYSRTRRPPLRSRRFFGRVRILVENLFDAEKRRK